MLFLAAQANKCSGTFACSGWKPKDYKGGKGKGGGGHIYFEMQLCELHLR